MLFYSRVLEMMVGLFRLCVRTQAALVLKIKANLSPVPALDNTAPYLNCGMGAPPGGITDSPGPPGGGKFVIFISKIRFYIEQGSKTFIGCFLFILQ
jgi:hypothetical protein